MDTIPVIISLTSGINENGEPNVVYTYAGKCCYNERTKVVRAGDSSASPTGEYVRTAGTIFIGKDIWPKHTIISGSVVMADRTFKILEASRPRNPDGTVHHTQLELI